MPVPLLVDPNDRPDQTWADPKRGEYNWRTLLSSDLMDSDTFNCGIVSMKAGDRWAVHRHAEAEIYLGLTGEADIEVDGRLFRLQPERLLYIPGNVFHGIPPTLGPFRFFYAFATDRFDKIRYIFREDE